MVVEPVETTIFNGALLRGTTESGNLPFRQVSPYFFYFFLIFFVFDTIFIFRVFVAFFVVCTAEFVLFPRTFLRRVCDVPAASLARREFIVEFSFTVLIFLVTGGSLWNRFLCVRLLMLF